MSCVSPRGISKLQGATVKAGFDQPGPKGPLPPKKTTPPGQQGQENSSAKLLYKRARSCFKCVSQANQQQGSPFYTPAICKAPPGLAPGMGIPR